MSRILIHEPVADERPRLASLGGRGREVVPCHDRESLVQALGGPRPDVLVYCVGRLDEDVALLTLLRRVAPALPIILVGDPTDLAARRAFQELKPTYFGVLPLEASELADVVQGALDRAAGRA